MKSIMLSIKPRHVANILNGLKTKEIRKRFPIDYRGWAYIYCTKDNIETLYKIKEPLGEEYYDYACVSKKGKDYDIFSNDINLNGKVIARFYCDNVEEINENYTYDFNCCIVDKRWYETKSLSANDLYEKSCLNRDDFDNYFKNKKTMKKCGYAIHISNLEIFDIPKELSEFKHLVKYKCETCPYNNEEETNNRCAFCEELLPVEKAPQNLMYIETE